MCVTAGARGGKVAAAGNKARHSLWFAVLPFLLTSCNSDLNTTEAAFLGGEVCSLSFRCNHREGGQGPGAAVLMIISKAVSENASGYRRKAVNTFRSQQKLALSAN